MTVRKWDQPHNTWSHPTLAKYLLAGESNPALPRSDDGGFRQWQAGVGALCNCYTDRYTSQEDRRCSSVQRCRSKSLLFNLLIWYLCISIYQLNNQFASLFAYLFLNLFVYLFVCLFVYLFIYLFIYYFGSIWCFTINKYFRVEWWYTVQHRDPQWSKWLTTIAKIVCRLKYSKISKPVQGTFRMLVEVYYLLTHPCESFGTHSHHLLSLHPINMGLAVRYTPYESNEIIFLSPPPKIPRTRNIASVEEDLIDRCTWAGLLTRIDCHDRQQTDRQTDRQTDKQTDRQTNKHIHDECYLFCNHSACRFCLVILLCRAKQSITKLN